MTRSSNSEFQQRMRGVEDLVDRIEALPDPAARELSRQLTAALLELHEAGLRRMLELLDDASDVLSGSHLVPPQWQDDPLISNLLILHRLHPLDVESRIENALSELQPLLQQNQLQLEITRLTDQEIHLQLSGGCGGCASSDRAIQHAIDLAICAWAPELQLNIDRLESVATSTGSMLPIVTLGELGS